MKIGLLPKEAIDDVFAKAETQGDYVDGLFRLAVPEFDRVKQVHGFVAVGPETSEYLWQKCIAFDRLHHPGVMAGGLWLNYGFATRQGIKPWRVSLKDVEIEYQSRVAATGK